MAQKDIPRLVIGIDHGTKDGDYSTECRGYWLNGVLHIKSIKEKKALPSFHRTGPQLRGRN